MKKVLREMQILHTGCSKAEPKNFRVHATPTCSPASYFYTD